MTQCDNFPPLKNDLIIKSALGQPVTRVPVWIMRQAGRYLPEFRKIREEYDFFKICQTPELACEVTLQPINMFQLDAAIIFSDILVIPQALGQVVEMQPGKGPVFPNPIKNSDDVKSLRWDVDIKIELKYVYEAITLTRHKLNGRCPLIGFAGGPWTLMSYMIEGGGSTTISKAKKWLYCDKDASHDFLNKLCNVICHFLLEQVKAGAQMLQVFESHAGILTSNQFSEFCIPYLKRISQFLKSEIEKLNLSYPIPIIIFAKGSHYAIEELTKLSYDVISLDWTINPANTRKITQDNVSLQGNLDPCALYCSNDDIIIQVTRMLNEFGCQRYIANLGHGVYPDTEPEKVNTFINAIHSISEEIIKEK